MPKLQPIRERPVVFVATDLSASADEALREGSLRASATNAELVVFHAIADLSRSNVLFPQRNAAEVSADDHLRRQALQALVARTQGVTGRSSLEFRALVDTGVAYSAIVRHAEDAGAQLLVVGDRGASALSRILLGGVAERVLRYAHAPVLVARASKRTGKVLVATDLSDPSLPALSAAARERGKNVTALHCLEQPTGVMAGEHGMYWGVPGSPDGLAELRSRAAQALSDACTRAGLVAEERVVAGSAAVAILAHADELEPELIILGTRGRTGLRRVLLGSVAEFVARHAACSVLVVRLSDGAGQQSNELTIQAARAVTESVATS